MVLYFTGTGNSRYLARRIAKGLDMPLYDRNACIKAGDTAPVLGCAEMEAETGEMWQELADLRKSCSISRVGRRKKIQLNENRGQLAQKIYAG